MSGSEVIAMLDRGHDRFLPYNATSTEINAFGAAIAVAGAVSVVGTALVVAVLWWYGGFNTQQRRLLVGLAAACFGYSLFWILPRYTSISMVSADFGGAPHLCDEGAERLCYESMCYTEGLMQLFATASIFLELFMLVLAMIAVIARRTVAIWTEGRIHFGLWMVCLALAMTQTTFCLTKEGRSRNKFAMNFNRFLAFGQIVVITFASIVAVAFYAFKVRPFVKQIRGQTLGAHFDILPDEYRHTRTMLLNTRMETTRRSIRPIVMYPLSFFLMSLPAAAYVVIDTIDVIRVEHHVEYLGAETATQYYVKNCSFVLLALRGFVSVSVLFFLEKEHRNMLTLRSIKDRLRHRRYLRQRGVSHVRFQEDPTILSGLTSDESEASERDSLILNSPRRHASASFSSASDLDCVEEGDGPEGVASDDAVR